MGGTREVPTAPDTTRHVRPRGRGRNSATPPKDNSKDDREHVEDALDFLENGHEEADDASDSSKRQLSTETPPVLSPVS
jgi:hypothetical protein